MVTHQLKVERRTGKVRRPETDVLPLSHATNLKMHRRCTDINVRVCARVCVDVRLSGEQHGVALLTKLAVYQAVVLSTLLYGCEYRVLSFEESRVAEPDRKRAARKQQGSSTPPARFGRATDAARPAHHRLGSSPIGVAIRCIRRCTSCVCR